MQENQNRLSEEFPVLLAVDPSINNLGWACYDFSKGGEMYDIRGNNWTYGIIHPKGSNIQYKWKDIYFKLRRELRDKQITHLASEWPMFFGGMKGKIAAQENYTVNLAGTVGYLVGKLGIKAEYVTLWTPVQWKGSVPKHVTQKKFIRLFGEAARLLANRVSDDVIDAIMIAEYWLTIYNREKFFWQQRRKVLIS